MTYNFDYKSGRSTKTFYSRCSDQAEARAKFDLWCAKQSKQVHLMRCWAV